MPKYKVQKLIQYTEVYYVEVDDIDDAVDSCDSIEPIIIDDDSWLDTIVDEITDEEYENGDS